ncbi:2-amino-4-hydroxy-6-hydroxymethyldihydropteridine diphosphokinase [Neolewinella xylanilytica]|uniref:2-amino-4-hydroxy-6-hydroxymethyldihydropteridine pyrophosphokinase n=1 Tax=Neolewinella xylanilytica TaxID=1514080 RepID=A0A2S6I5A6_9BACT|nr:2-amino-4-hydroxy-6-hydroxymethyldihydropteridine diphosphokinase [Neolewinella xylanilytica]
MSVAKLTLSLGSNLGNRDQYLAQARERLSAALGQVVYASDVITTPPWGLLAQQDFRNQVLVIDLGFPTASGGIREQLHRILEVTQTIECDLERVRHHKWGPRTLDIDIIFVDDLIYEDERISLPHPWWWYRSFVKDLLPGGLLDPHGRVLDAGQLR